MPGLLELPKTDDCGKPICTGDGNGKGSDFNGGTAGLEVRLPELAWRLSDPDLRSVGEASAERDKPLLAATGEPREPSFLRGSREFAAVEEGLKRDCLLGSAESLRSLNDDTLLREAAGSF
jgi:hypothetical protein